MKLLGDFLSNLKMKKLETEVKIEKHIINPIIN